MGDRSIGVVVPLGDLSAEYTFEECEDRRRVINLGSGRDRVVAWGARKGHHDRFPG
jgi:hypothetical protein